MAFNVHAKVSPQLDPSSWRDAYGELVKKYSETGQIPYLDDYLLAVFTSKYDDPPAPLGCISLPALNPSPPERIGAKLCVHFTREVPALWRA